MNHKVKIMSPSLQNGYNELKIAAVHLGVQISVRSYQQTDHDKLSIDAGCSVLLEIYLTLNTSGFSAAVPFISNRLLSRNTQ